MIILAIFFIGAHAAIENTRSPIRDDRRYHPRIPTIERRCPDV